MNVCASVYPLSALLYIIINDTSGYLVSVLHDTLIERSFIITGGFPPGIVP